MKIKFRRSACWEFIIQDYICIQFAEDLIFFDEDCHRMNKYGIKHYRNKNHEN